MAQKSNIHTTIDGLTFLPDRRPDMTDQETENAFATLADYRDGGIFVGHYAGNSEWERHPGDEIVTVIEGATTITLLIDGEEQPNLLTAGDLIVVPEDVWHRFETPDGVKIMSVTPLPGDHQVEFPLQG